MNHDIIEVFLSLGEYNQQNVFLKSRSSIEFNLGYQQISFVVYELASYDECKKWLTFEHVFWKYRQKTGWNNATYLYSIQKICTVLKKGM